jgi:hypothetical protein
MQAVNPCATVLILLPEIPQASMFTAANIFGSILFGSIGLGAFIYGRKSAAAKPLIIGAVLMIYPYFVSETWQLYAIGVLLTASLFLFRNWGN